MNPTVDVSAVLAECRAEAILVGPRGRSYDWRVADACARAAGLVRPDVPALWSGAPDQDASEVWLGCLRDSVFTDVSGWPRIQIGDAERCMNDKGFVRVERAGAVVVTR